MKKRSLLLLFILIVSLLTAVSCSGDGDTEGDTVKVMLAVSEGITVKTQNPLEVKSGENAEFEVELGSTYVIESIEGGVYEDGKVTVSNVTKNTTVNLKAIDLGYDTTVSYKYYFEGTDKDTTSHESAKTYNAGTSVTVKAGDDYRTFLGWSFTSSTTDPASIASAEREFTFRLSPDCLNSQGDVRIYANYIESNVYYYDLNGGAAKTVSANLSPNGFYKTKVGSTSVAVTVSESYLSVFESVSLFYDDGTFYRDGYVLKEYNTEKDGSGVGYSLGSKYYLDLKNPAVKTLYCIWEKASDKSEFRYENFNYACPVSESHAPNWKVDGIKITEYLGNSEQVVIPETIDGKFVTAIGAGAFTNKEVKTLVLSKYLLKIEDGAFRGCSGLKTIYFPDSIYDIKNEALDESSYTSLKNFYVNATLAPRYSASSEGAFSVKLSRLMASYDKNRIIVLGGSSAYQGLSSAYMEALLGDAYRVINFGTTRTTNGIIYLEAMQSLAHAGDVVLYAPENSSYMMGEGELYWKTLRDLESMNNFYRYIDISNYTNVLSAFGDFNKNYRYVNSRPPKTYEDSYTLITSDGHSINKYGEHQRSDRGSVSSKYVDAYFITMNNRFKSKFEGEWNDTSNQQANKDYKDPNNATWVTVNEGELLSRMNRAIDKAKSSGAKVYFSFSPADADKLVEEAKSVAWLEAYDNMILSSYHFDGTVGTSREYIYNHAYFYDCAFHLNDIGRTYRTYQLYTDICEKLGLNKGGFLSVGVGFEGCIFENGVTDGTPKQKVDFLN